MQQLDQVAVLLHRRHRILQVGQTLKNDRQLGHLAEIYHVVLKLVQMSCVQWNYVLQMDAALKKNKIIQNNYYGKFFFLNFSFTNIRFDL